MNPLQFRKQLLVAESTLNRAQLVADVTAFAADVRSLTIRYIFLGSVASSAAVLVAGLAAFQNARAKNPEVKQSWFRTLLKGAGFASTLWLAFRSRGRDRDGT